MAWYVITCPDHGKVTTADYPDEAAVLAGAHDALHHRGGEPHAGVGIVDLDRPPQTPQPEHVERAARLEAIREQVEAGTMSVAESARLVPEWAPFADFVYRDHPEELNLAVQAAADVDANWDAEGWDSPSHDDPAATAHADWTDDTGSGYLTGGPE